MSAQSFTRVLRAADQQFSLLSMTLAAAEAAVAGTAVILPGLAALTVQAVFVRAGGGTSAQYWIQTSLDGGTTWIDVMCFAFATTTATKVSGVVGSTALAAAVTPGSGALADNTILSGLLGDRIRVLRTTVGTYTGASSIAIGAIARG